MVSSPEARLVGPGSLRTLIATMVALLALASSAHRARAQLPGPAVDLAVPVAPTPFTRDGVTNLVYEVHVTNMSQVTTLLTRVEVVNDESGRTLATYTGQEIMDHLARPIPATKLLDGRMIESGKRGVLYMWVSLERGSVPLRIRHRLAFASLDGVNEQTVEGARVTVRARKAPVIGAPLRGTGWAARFLSNSAAHRRSLTPLHGRLQIGQRFAIDFGKKGPDGTEFHGEGNRNSDAWSYDQDILAVADGVVGRIQDGIAENDPSQPSALPTRWDLVFGNYLVLDIGDGNYAMYCHIRPGSFTVKPGDRVRRGQVMAHVGNSGNATGPHLHFQMCDSPDPLDCEGVPYEFDRFEVLGFETMDQFQAQTWSPDPTFHVKRYTSEMTPDMSIVRFEDTGQRIGGATDPPTE